MKDLFKFRWLLPMFTMLLLLFAVPMAAIAQGTGDVTETTDYEAAFATFAALVAVVPFVVQGIKKLIPSIESSSLWTQVVSWLTGIVITMFGWVFNLGFLNGLEWWQALLYGLGASLAANGIFDTGLIEWIIGLFKKKSLNDKASH
jgi:hypothetical protein